MNINIKLSLFASDNTNTTINFGIQSDGPEEDTKLVKTIVLISVGTLITAFENSMVLIAADQELTLHPLQFGSFSFIQ